MRGKTPTENPDRLNVIVEGSKVIGDIITESNLRIDGEVSGNVTSASKVVIGVNGKVKGNLSCKNADIEGYVDGIIKTESLLSLRANANVTGEISTSKIQIDEGAKFSGNCKMNNMTKISSTADVEMEKKQGVAY